MYCLILKFLYNDFILFNIIFIYDIIIFKFFSCHILKIFFNRLDTYRDLHIIFNEGKFIFSNLFKYMIKNE